MTDKGESKEYIDDVEGIGYGWATPCNKCVFADYKGNVQYDCKLGRLEKFKKKNIEVIPAFDLERDFFVVKSFCNAYRTEEWAKKQEQGDHAEKVRKENQVRIHFIIIAGDGRDKKTAFNEDEIDEMMDAIDKTGFSILNQNIKPVTVVLVNNSPLHQFEAYHKAHEIFNKTGVKFSIVEMGQDLDDLACIDEGFNDVGGGFYVVFKAGHVVDSSFSDKIDSLVNEELESLAFVEGYDGLNGMTVQCSMHKYLKGNAGVPLKQKITEISEEDGSTKNLIRSWEEFNGPS
jgi:hypothetical protein